MLIGNMKWKQGDLFDCLEEFKEIYESRILPDNTGGMKSAHMFPAWFIVKKLKPKFLIESGVWQGLGTLFFRKASPETKIISIDPVPGYRMITLDDVEYMTEDFLETDWKKKLRPSQTLVFFDDHQNFMPRLKKCKELGFKKLIFEDNYPVNQGDCYSPRKILSQRDYVIDAAGSRSMHPHVPEDFNYLMDTLKSYQEMPPLFKPEYTRWGDRWEGADYETPPALLSEMNVLEYQTFFNESKDYTWLCYMELK